MTAPSKTWSPKAGEVERRWYVVNAEGLPLGRLSTVVAKVLMGKHKPTYAPHIDTGDFVIVTNAEKTTLSGNKEEEKLYRRHSGKPGKLKEETAAMLRARRPARLVELAVRGMLPKTKMGRKFLGKLKIYAGSGHPHVAQNPEVLDVTTMK